MIIKMRISILIAFALSVVVEANFLAAAARGIEPIILSVGTVFAAIGLDINPIRDIPLFKIEEHDDSASKEKIKDFLKDKKVMNEKQKKEWQKEME